MTTVDPTPNAGLGAHAGDWRLDTAKTTITFRTKAMWVVPVKGTAKALSGEGHVSEDGTVEGTLVIDATSIDTGMKKRDAHLQTADFFDTANHPTIDFTIIGAQPTAPGRFAVDGQLTILGNSKPVVLDAKIASGADGVTVSATIDDLDRAEWGLSWAKMGAGVHNRIEVDALFTRT